MNDGFRNFTFIEGDIRSIETCRQACTGIDLVLYEAALDSAPRYRENLI